MGKTTVVNIKNQQCDIYIGRGSKWGNPYKMSNASDWERIECVITMKILSGLQVYTTVYRN